MTNAKSSSVLTKSSIRVLLAEDNHPDACLVAKILEKSDLAEFQIDRASSLAEAIRKGTHDHYDVVLLDLFLPDSGGLATLETFLATNRSVPIIVLTGYEQETIGIEAIRKGAEEY